MSTIPVLYSFRRCPYAMRARIALHASGITTELREVVLKEKPQHLLDVSEKATVPVLITEQGKVIDESLDIIYWALQQNDPHGWYQTLNEVERQQAQQLILHNDGEFKYYLDRYKYADRYPEQSLSFYRQKAEETLTHLENRLKSHNFLLTNSWSIADIAILPFIRQFAFVDKAWFDSSSYTLTKKWLNTFLNSPIFTQIMPKYAQWHQGDEPVLFPVN